jgi:hypothetical protein
LFRGGPRHRRAAGAGRHLSWRHRPRCAPVDDARPSTIRAAHDARPSTIRAAHDARPSTMCAASAHRREPAAGASANVETAAARPKVRRRGCSAGSKLRVDRFRCRLFRLSSGME